MNALTVLTSEIRQLDGLYSLNDLHQAAGSEVRHQPSRFMRLDTTQKLVSEIEQSPDMVSATKTINGGPHRGTYVCKELVYAYAMWISPSFHLKVIRAFDALQATQPDHHGPSTPPAPGPADAAQLRAIIRAELAATPASGDLLPPQQAREITERLDRLCQIFHPFSDPFADALGIYRALRGLHPKIGKQEPGYRRVIEHPTDRNRPR